MVPPCCCRARTSYVSVIEVVVEARVHSVAMITRRRASMALCGCRSGAGPYMASAGHGRVRHGTTWMEDDAGARRMAATPLTDLWSSRPVRRVVRRRHRGGGWLSWMLRHWSEQQVVREPTNAGPARMPCSWAAVC